MTDKPQVNTKLLEKIVKLFRLGSEGRNDSEEEMMSAITMAKRLMAQHNIEMAEVQTALSGTENGKAINFEIIQDWAYTRKIRDLAKYDHCVAQAVGALTGTRPFLQHRGGYTSMVFVGDMTDVALAKELFMIFLEAVRTRTRRQYGSGWSKNHTEYAVGFGVRLIHRAEDMVSGLSKAEENTMALVVRSKETSIQEYLAKMNVTQKKQRATAYGAAYRAGYEDGGSFSLETKVVGGAAIRSRKTNLGPKKE